MEFQAREAARIALSLHYVRADRRMAVARRFAWACEAARHLPQAVLALIFDLAQ